MNLTNLLVWIVVGAVAGWLASMVMGTGRRQGCITDIIIGIAGGLIGGYILDLLNVGGGVTGLNLVSVVTAFIGAVVLLAGLRVLRRL